MVIDAVAEDKLDKTADINARIEMETTGDDVVDAPPTSRVIVEGRSIVNDNHESLGNVKVAEKNDGGIHG